MEETAKDQQAPACPGCHFGCSLDAYRCGRGKGFSEKWRAGEPVPERRGPGKGGPGGPGKGGPGGPGGPGRGGLPTGMRVMHALNIMANKLQDRHTESAERKVLASIDRQGGFFALDMLGRRALVDQPQLDEAIASLTAEGLAESAQDPIAGDILRITEAGRMRQREWNAEREASTAEFLAPLTEEEQDQLAHLIFRLLKG